MMILRFFMYKAYKESKNIREIMFATFLEEGPMPYRNDHFTV